MNQIKIGKFILNCRKEKGLTQEQLAEKLGVTSKSISRWENGKTMPDYSLLKDLCNELDINVNELLSAEKIKVNDYMNKSEENLIKLRKQIDKRKKVLTIISYVFMTIIIIAFVLNMILNRLLPDDRHWNIIRYTFLYSGITLFIVSIVLELFKFDK
ncbi:MAG: helix-turn-helix transcriptional regulator [Bacilli bacterium]|nr:helix-turn-helix transcriptional regulator [Bacilli bacterium]